MIPGIHETPRLENKPERVPPARVWIELRGALAEETPQGWFLRRRAADRLRVENSRQDIRIVMDENLTCLPESIERALECQGVEPGTLTLAGPDALDTLFENPVRTFLILGSSRAGVIETVPSASRWRAVLAAEHRLNGLERAWDRVNEASAIEKEVLSLRNQEPTPSCERLIEGCVAAARAAYVRTVLEDALVRRGSRLAETGDLLDNLEILIGRLSEYTHACERAHALLTGQARRRVWGKCPHPILIGGTLAWENLCLTCEIERLLERDKPPRKNETAAAA